MKRCPYCGFVSRTKSRACIYIPGSYLLPGKYCHGKMLSLGKNQCIELIVYATLCPKCANFSIYLEASTNEKYKKDFNHEKLNIEKQLVYPLLVSPPVDESVPEEIAKDYIEAHKVQHISRVAATMLARRCLQQTIRYVLKKNKSNLYEEIIEFVEKEKLDKEIKEALLALKNAGNFAAHQDMKDDLPVRYNLTNEDLEACFKILNYLFKKFFSFPAQTKQSINELTDKYNSANSKKSEGKHE